MHHRQWKHALLGSFCVFLTISGCAAFGDQPTTYIMQNPETMEFVNCVVDKWETEESFAANDKCVKDYQEKGYIIWGER